MKKILITREIPSIAQEMLEKKFEVSCNKSPFFSKEQLIQAVQEYDGILSAFSDGFSSEVLLCKKRLEVISNYAVGLDNIDVDCAKKMHIHVYHLPHIVTNSTADLTLALLLALVRKIPEAKEFVKKDLWRAWDPRLFLGEELEGKTWGILGFGRIGQAVATRALGFGIRVLFSSHFNRPISHSLGASIFQVSLKELFSQVDYLSLHLPLTSETRGMIDLAAMRLMKKRPIIINMSRGAVIKTEDLVIALKEGILRAAALDVTDPEPLSGKHPLCHLENCLITPHIGTSTVECRQQMAKKAAENLLHYFERKK